MVVGASGKNGEGDNHNNGLDTMMNIFIMMTRIIMMMTLMIIMIMKMMIQIKNFSNKNAKKVHPELYLPPVIIQDNKGV